MFYLRSVYISSISFLLVLVLGCFVEALIKRTKISNDVANLEFTCFICLFSYLVAILLKNETLSELFYAIYSACLDFAVYMILLFLYTLEHQDIRVKKIIVNRRIYEVLALADLILLFTNFLTHFYFKVEPVYVGNEFFCMTPVYKPQYYFIHILLCYGLSVIVTIRFVVDIVKTPRPYKSKYIIQMILFVSVILINACVKICIQLNQLDFSLIAYGILMIAGFTFTNYLLPKGLKRNMLTMVSDKISDAVICYDSSGRCIYENNLARKLNIDDSEDCEWLEEFFESKVTSIHKREKLIVDGNEHVFDVEFQCIKDKTGKTSGYYVKLMDQTSELEAIEREQYRSTHDELTGLYNRKFFFAEIERILKETPDIPRYLITTDIDNFKLVNDLYGITYGDNVLRYQAEMLKKAAYADTILGRISGDKFGMLIRKENFKPELAVKNTKSIVQFDGNTNYHFNMYIGLYEIANPYENVISMCDKANMAIENNTDKNQILCVYDTSLMNKVVHENNVVSDFKYAIEHDEFCMFLQPQIDSETGKCIGGEALCRWYDQNGYRQPSEFIPILEKAGLIYKLDSYIWEKAVQKLSEWKQKNLDYYISVNISVKDFYYADLYSVFTKLVNKYQVSPHKLHLEITESVIIGDKDFHRGILNKLKAYGFSIEMDDFGSGFSSMNALKEMNMNVLKIDMGFLRATANEERGRVIIASIVKMAKALGMEVISEGVETEKQADFLKSIGVDIFQGYLYSKPIAVEEFEHKYVEALK